MRINILDVIYPVGSYYFTSEAVSPAASVGGSWEQIEEGTFLCAAGDTFVVNSRGGLTK